MTEPPQNGAETLMTTKSIVVTRMDRRTFYALLMCFLSCLMLSVATGIYVAKSSNDTLAKANQSTKNFCSLVQTLDSSYRAAPPQTVTGRLVASEIHDLVIHLGCVSQ